jgi:hypothetical protein
MDVLLLLTAMAVGALIVLAAAILALTVPTRRPSQVLALIGTALGLVWIVLTYQGGVLADETGSSGDIRHEAGWLAAAVAVSVASLLTRAKPEVARA